MADYKHIESLKNIEDFEKAISDGYEIPIYSWIKIKSKNCFVDKIPRIDIYFNADCIDYSKERLNEILYAAARKSIEEIIKERSEAWQKLKKRLRRINFQRSKRPDGEVI